MTQNTLVDYIAANLSTPFEWGRHDCVTFAIGWLSLVTGVNMLAPYGNWTSELQALRAIKRAGGIQAQFDARLKRIAPNYAHDGDVALLDGIVYLFSGAQLVGPGPGGLVFRSRKEAQHAWTL